MNEMGVNQWGEMNEVPYVSEWGDVMRRYRGGPEMDHEYLWYSVEAEGLMIAACSGCRERGWARPECLKPHRDDVFVAHVRADGGVGALAGKVWDVIGTPPIALTVFDVAGAYGDDSPDGAWVAVVRAALEQYLRGTPILGGYDSPAHVKAFIIAVAEALFPDEVAELRRGGAA